MQDQKRSGTALKLIITILVYILAAAAGYFITADDPFALPLLPSGAEEENVISGEVPEEEPAVEEEQEETGEKDGKKKKKKEREGAKGCGKEKGRGAYGPSRRKSLEGFRKH